MAQVGSVWLSGGEGNQAQAKVLRILRHPSYNTESADYDAALLELAEPLAFSKYVQPVCLPAPSHRFPPGRKCLISGWGYLKEDFCKQGPWQSGGKWGGLGRVNPPARAGADRPTS